MQSILNIERSSSSLKPRVVQLTPTTNPFHDRLIVPMHGQIHLISINDIMYCQAEGNYTKVVQQSGQSVLMSQCLKHVLNKLEQNGLMRIHQSYAVPSKLIRTICTNTVTLVNGKEIPLSRQYRKRLVTQLSI